MAGTMHELRGVVGPAGAYRGPRGQILVELKRTEPLSAKELAARLGLSLNAVRHHLKELEAEGVLEYVREHRSVGAPAFAYRLSAQGQALFPRRYQETLTYILEHVAVRDGRTAAIAMLEGALAGHGGPAQGGAGRPDARAEGRCGHAAPVGGRLHGRVAVGRAGRRRRSGSTTAPSTRSRSASPRSAPPRSGSWRRCWGRRSSGGSTS